MFSSLLACGVLSACSVLAQSANGTDFSEWWSIAEYPNAQTTNVSKYLNEAALVAGDDLGDHFERRCVYTQLYDELSSAAQLPGFVPPIEVFDDVFFVGQSFVSAWAIKTSSGVVLIDALNNADEAEQVLIPGLAAFNLTGEDIVALIITHEHFDHYGGARWLQDTYSIPVYASEVAWKAMANGEEGRPLQDKILTDGQELDFGGNFSIRCIATPGHTPGTMSFVFPVLDHGVPHIVGMNGGAGIPNNASAKEDHIRSYAKFAAIAEELGVDTQIANHQSQDRALTNFDLLNARECTEDGCVQENPFVIGTEAFVRFLQVMALCDRTQAAREGQSLAV